jgi:hypothetical protein
MVMHPHTKYNWPISKDKKFMAWTRKYYLKNNYVTLRSKSHEGHYGIRHTALWSCTHIPNKYYLKKQLFDLEVKVQRRSLRYVTHRLMVMHPHTKYHWSISKEKNVMARTRKYSLKNNYLTLLVKVPWRSLWYATHRLMVMHPHTKYNWLIWKDKKVMIWKDKKVMVQTSFPEKKQKWKRKKKSD